MGFFEQMQNESNVGYTENGAKVYATTQDSLLNFFSQAGAMRNWREGDILELFYQAFAEDRIAAIQLLFYFRDVRGGQGERRIFRIVMTELCKEYPEIARKLLVLVPKYGRWDDLYSAMGTSLELEVWNIINMQLKEDLMNYVNGREVSLLAKWLKSERTHGKTNTLGLKTRKGLKLKSEDYRKILSALRAEIGIVERPMSRGDWDSIDFPRVPSQAMRKLSRAFDRNTPRFAEYLKEVEEGKQEIKAATLYPYQLVGEVLKGGMWGGPGASRNEKTVLNEQWKALPNYLSGLHSDALVIADVSGSMYGHELSAPINISVALALYLAERGEGTFQNKFITFSEKPQLVEVQGKDLWEKAKFISQADWGMNTNLRAVMKLILNTAIKNGTPQSEMPKRLVVISDMQFDQGTRHNSFLRDEFEAMFNQHGYQLPLIVWWNVNATNSTFPMKADQRGLMVSGASPEIMKAVLSNDFLHPMDLVNEVLNRERYEIIARLLREV